MTARKTLHREAPAKINLFLEVLGKRPDGFHEIRTVLAPLAFCDSLTATEADRGVRIEIEGADLPVDSQNLAVLAAERFLGRYAPESGVRLTLTKRIPVAAGLGGGSSDAAATLLLLMDLLRPGLTVKDLLPFAADLGSDVPYFLHLGLALGEGRGERVTPLGPAPESWLGLFLPPFGVSTPKAYGSAEVPEADDRRAEDDLLAALRGGTGFAAHLFNRLESGAFVAEPRLPVLRDRLARVLAPGERILLSGSGSTLFAPVGRYSRAVEVARQWGRLAAGRAIAVKMSPREIADCREGED